MGLHKTHISHTGIEAAPPLAALGKTVPNAKNAIFYRCDAVRPCPKAELAALARLPHLGLCHADSAPPLGLHRDKPVLQQLAAFVFIRRRHHHHIGDGAQVAGRKRHGEGPSSPTSPAVNRKEYVEVLQGDIVNQLIIGTLQKVE